MYKLISIALIVALLGTACSGLRKGVVSERHSYGNQRDSVLLGRVQKNNISRVGYFIKRADIEIIKGEQSDKIVATIRKNGEFDYLVSLKSKTGIEAARVYIGRDTLMINDRINNALYVGSSDYIEKKYSVGGSLLPLIFGDFVSMTGNIKSDSVCNEGKFSYRSNSKGVQISYVVDCELGKVVKAIIESERNSGKLILLYSEFQKIGDITYPGKIEISGLPDKMVLKIEIKSIDVPWIGEINFIPGNRYEIIELK